MSRTVPALVTLAILVVALAGPALAGPALVGPALVDPALAGPSASAPDRLAEIRADVAQTGVHVGSGVASGRTALWERRLRRTLDRTDFAHPVSVALWQHVDGIGPPEVSSEDDPGALFESLGLRRGGLLVIENGILYVVTHRVPEAFRDRVLSLWNRQLDLASEVVAASPDPDRYRGLTDVAQAWLFLRLAAEDPPADRALVEELARDDTVLQDYADPPRRTGYGDREVLHVKDLWVAGAVLLLTVGIFVVWSRRSASLRQDDVDPFAAGLTSLTLNQELADLAEEIAASDVSPGDPDYDRAQACADAAAKYVDSDRQRDRVGAHLLIQDGRRAVAGQRAPNRCFFHPQHVGISSVQREGTRVKCCPECATAVVKGRRPRVLLVADRDGEVAPYFETRDVWTETGYGAVDEHYARRALLAALERR